MQTKELQHALIRLFAIVVAGSKDKLSNESDLLIEAYFSDYVPVRDRDSTRILFYKLIKEHNLTDSLKKLSSNSVKILRICNSVNRNNSSHEKLELLVHLLAFVHSLHEFNKWSSDFIDSVADNLNIKGDEYNNMRWFASGDFENIPKSNIYKTNQGIVICKIADDVLLIQSLESDLYLNGRVYNPFHLLMVPYGALIEVGDKKTTWHELMQTFNKNDKSYSLIVDNVSYKIGDKQILHPVSFVLPSASTMAVMGASGAGKSTLLKIISGIIKAEGSVFINTSKDRENLKLAYVPQDDALIPEFNASQMLHDRLDLLKACKLPLQDIDIVDALKMLGLYDVKNQCIGLPNDSDLSGGQLKRISIAMEILRDVPLLCLDEPSSGLADADAFEVVSVLRSIASQGKMIIASLHQPSFDLLSQFDSLLIIDKGGYPVYYGTPAEAPFYLRNIAEIADQTAVNCSACGSFRPAELFDIIEGETNGTRRITAEEWYKNYKKLISDDSKSITNNKKVLNKKKSRGFIKRAWVYLKRDIQRMLIKKWPILLNILLPLILVLLITGVSKSGSNPYLFANNPNLPVALMMLIISALFSGMVSFSAAINGDSIFRFSDRIIDEKEGAYISAKIIQTILVSTIVALVFTSVFVWLLGIYAMFFKYFIVLFLVVWFGSLTALCLSKWIKSIALVNLLIPVLIIPQLMLSGLVIPYQNLPKELTSKKYVPFVADMALSRWAFEAMAVSQYTNNDLEFYFNSTRVNLHQANYYLYYFLPAINELKNTEPERANKILQNEYFKYPKLPQLNASIKEQIKLLNNIFTNQRMQALNQEEEIYNQLSKVYDMNQFSDDYVNIALKHLLLSDANQQCLIIEENNIVRKYMPVYHLPFNRLGRSHMYSPAKLIGNTLIPTHIFNTIIMLFMNLICVILLYFPMGNRKQ